MADFEQRASFQRYVDFYSEALESLTQIPLIHTSYLEWKNEQGNFSIFSTSYADLSRSLRTQLTIALTALLLEDTEQGTAYFLSAKAEMGKIFDETNIHVALCFIFSGFMNTIIGELEKGQRCRECSGRRKGRGLW